MVIGHVERRVAVCRDGDRRRRRDGDGAVAWSLAKRNVEQMS